MTYRCATYTTWGVSVLRGGLYADGLATSPWT